MNYCKDCMFAVYNRCGKFEVDRRPDKSICDNDHACEYFIKATVNINTHNTIADIRRALDTLRIQSLELPRFVLNEGRVDITIPPYND